MTPAARLARASALAASALAASALSFAGCDGPRHAEKPPRPVRVEVVAAAPTPPPLRFSGTIEPSRQVTLAFEQAGTVAAIAQAPGADGRPRPLEAGDRVAAGALLARLDGRDAAQRAAGAAARTAEARAVAAKAEKDLARAETLYAQKAATLPELEAARTGAERARQEIAAAAAQEALARRGEEQTWLVAPFAGTVLRRAVEIGSLAAPGAPAFELADTRVLEVVFGVPDTVVGRLAAGQRLPFVAQVLAGSSFFGTVAMVSPSADPQSRVFRVEVAIPDPDPRLRIGMIVSVEVPAPQAESGGAVRPAVPLAAVVRAQQGEGYAVFVIEDGGDGRLLARERAVEVGEIFGSEVALESGLGLGQKVVVAGATLLADGDAVVVIP